MAENEPRKRRRLRAPSETVRERAAKAQITAGKSAKPRKSQGIAAKILLPFSYIAKGLRFIGRFIIPPYIRNSWKELRLVTWPSWKQSRRLTFAVIVFALIFGVLIFGVDYVLDKAFKHFILK